ncbi:putative membrane protein [Campylobacter pinnipediorum subsp. caledonicus]|uniref:Putative membrane protein n=1 Tax=Campylobacter pinnipediorum subsp. caledonicus TaxID=1874362 RepID=A0A1S6U8S3_9BACT|nr:hypothetical protein [Campylobacter pinnipediorum]AQW86448.1 putative membrane protein [Campylobacter pinnipediorum subsp. caledonicus]AQW88100.1 putative membrane protein [Campylobacter pinnipediorum subsp. caledonicus]
MTKNILLKDNDLLDFYTFMVTSSKKARNTKIFNTIGVFSEIMIAFFILGFMLEKNILIIVGFILSFFWLFFYPFFLKNKQKKILKSFKINNNIKNMYIDVSDNYIAFYSDTKKDENTFLIDNISEIYECKNIFIVFISDSIHIIIPKNIENTDIVRYIAKKADKNILVFESLSYNDFLN